jgi:uncharacterized protein (DUF305 family)
MREDGLQQLVIIVMMVVFGIFNLIANWLRKRSEQGTTGGREGSVTDYEMDPEPEFEDDLPPVFHEEPEIPRAERQTVPERAAERPWWDMPAEEPGPAARPPGPVGAPPSWSEPSPHPAGGWKPPTPAPDVIVRHEPPRITPAEARSPARRERTPARAPRHLASAAHQGTRGARFTRNQARRGMILLTVLGPCRGVEPSGPNAPRHLPGLVAILFLVAGCATSAAPARIPQPAPPAAVVLDDSAGMARARADSARYPYTEADIHFMSGMIHHHAQAIAVSRLAPTHGASESVQRLASRIISSQQDEIVTMQQWLADRRQPVPVPNPAGMTMTMDGVEHTMLMPGMLTPAQMEQLDSARGAEFDRLFLTLMIQHHRGAITMVEELFGTHGAGQDEAVFRFASDVQVDQITEIERMQRMLAALMFPPPNRQ